MLYSFAVCSDNEKEGDLDRNIQWQILGNCSPTHTIQENISLGQKLLFKVGLGEGEVGSLPESYSDPLNSLEVLVLSPILTTGRKIINSYWMKILMISRKIKAKVSVISQAKCRG